MLCFGDCWSCVCARSGRYCALAVCGLQEMESIKLEWWRKAFWRVDLQETYLSVYSQLFWFSIVGACCRYVLVVLYRTCKMFRPLKQIFYLLYSNNCGWSSPSLPNSNFLHFVKAHLSHEWRIKWRKAWRDWWSEKNEGNWVNAANKKKNFRVERWSGDEKWIKTRIESILFELNLTGKSKTEWKFTVE